jgi:hypothetical protein
LEQAQNCHKKRLTNQSKNAILLLMSQRNAYTSGTPVLRSRQALPPLFGVNSDSLSLSLSLSLSYNRRNQQTLSPLCSLLTAIYSLSFIIGKNAGFQYNRAFRVADRPVNSAALNCEDTGFFNILGRSLL